MSEKHDIAGRWWFPTNPDERWLGTLKFEPDKAPHLSIPLAKSFDEAEKLGQPPAILGHNINGFPIALLFPGWPRLHGGTELCQMDFSAHHALIGIHFANEDDFKVNSLNIRLQRLQAWLEAYHGTKFASHGEKGFCGKIQELTEKYKSHLNGLVADVPEFAKTVSDNRHYYTHHNPEDLKNGRVVSGSKLIQLNEKLTLIFRMCILTEMGIASDRFERLRFQLAQKTMDLI